jgi:hypothetical protein
MLIVCLEPNMRSSPAIPKAPKTCPPHWNLPWVPRQWRPLTLFLFSMTPCSLSLFLRTVFLFLSCLRPGETESKLAIVLGTFDRITEYLINSVNFLHALCGIWGLIGIWMIFPREPPISHSDNFGVRSEINL